MSQYLCVGIARSIAVKKYNMWGEFSTEEIKKDFFKTVDENLYNISEDNIYVYFELKNELLVKYGIDLIKEQYEKYLKTIQNEDIIKELEEINLKTNREKLKIFSEGSRDYLNNLKLGWYGLNACAFFDISVSTYITEMIVYHFSYKTFMEEYCDFFKYIRNLLINSTDNPLRTAMTIAL